MVYIYVYITKVDQDPINLGCRHTAYTFEKVLIAVLILTRQLKKVSRLKIAALFPMVSWFLSLYMGVLVFPILRHSTVAVGKLQPLATVLFEK